MTQQQQPRIGDKWTVMVVGALSQGPIRYNEVRRRVEGISSACSP